MAARKGGMQPLTSPFAESRKGCSDPTLSATRLRMLEPRHVTEERGKHTQEQGVLAIEDHNWDLSPGVIFKAYSSGLYWPSQGHQFRFFLLLLSLMQLLAALPRLCRAQGSLSQGRSCRRCVSAGSTRAPGSIPKQTGLFCRVQKVCLEGCDETWPKFPSNSYLK